MADATTTVPIKPAKGGDYFVVDPSNPNPVIVPWPLTPTSWPLIYKKGF